MINVNALASKVFGLLRGHGYTLVMYTVDGSETLDPESARRFFVSVPTTMVTIDESSERIIMSLSNEIELKDVHVLSSQLKRLANEYLLNYTVKKFNKSIQPRDFAYQAKIEKEKTMEGLNESISRMFGSKLTSYQTVSEVRIHVKHTKPVNEETRGARSRNIKSIFLEKAGERFRFPSNHLMSARAMARHMSFGGNMSDTVGNYILESAHNYTKLREFLTYTKRNGLINEDTTDTISTIIESIESLKSNLTRLSGAQSYHVIAERLSSDSLAPLTEESDDLSELKDRFTVKRFDERFEEILPCVSRIIKEKESFLAKIEESSKQPIRISKRDHTFESSIIEFENQFAEVGYRLGQLAESMLDNDSLSTYVSKVARKISEQQDLTAFEVSVIGNIFENIDDEEDEDEVDEGCGSGLKESALFESKINSIVRLFV